MRSKKRIRTCRTPGNSCTTQWRTNFPLVSERLGKRRRSQKGRRRVAFVTQAILPASFLYWCELPALSTEIADRIVCVAASASFLFQRDQKHHDADRRQNDGDGESRGRDFA